jgi:hypothetical protein
MKKRSLFFFLFTPLFIIYLFLSSYALTPRFAISSRWVDKPSSGTVSAKGVYSVDPWRRSLVKHGERGETLWSRQSGSMITALFVSEKALIIGTLSGNAYIMDSDGKTVSSFLSGGNGNQPVYGAAISNDASRAAIISGSDPQMLILHEKRENRWSLKSEWALPDNVLRETAVDFIYPGALLRIDRDSSILTVDTLSGSFSKYHYDGVYLGTLELPGQLFSIMVVARDDGLLVFFDNKGIAFLELDLKGHPFWLAEEEGEVMIGFEDRQASLVFSSF